MKQGCEPPEPPVCFNGPQYEGGEQCSVCGHQLRLAEAALSASVGPSEILPYFLYVGSYDSASRSELLKARGMTHILNVRTIFLAHVLHFAQSTHNWLAGTDRGVNARNRLCQHVSRFTETPLNTTRSAANPLTFRSASTS